mmetsp:Transcript_17987/g.53286  ORF Transcript_17987/g.53286 Transcript_17987/m.53286 type:complete len:158 (+) Transcript_17987:767-1240(+)
MGGQNDGAVSLRALQQIPHQSAIDGVKPRGGLVKEEQLDAVADACQRNRQSPLHPTRERRHTLPRHLTQGELVEHRAGCCVDTRLMMAPQPQEEPGVLPRCQLRPQHVVLRASLHPPHRTRHVAIDTPPTPSRIMREHVQLYATAASVSTSAPTNPR